MASVKQSSKKRLSRKERAERQMQELFFDTQRELIWTRTTNDGYSTIPRTFPIVMQAIDHQSKGTPAGHTLFCLWARSPDHPLVTIENPAIFAHEAGFSGERAVHTWRQKMKKLEELNFIMSVKGASGDYHYVLLLNPNVAVERMHQKGLVQRELYIRFKDYLGDIGALSDIDDYLEMLDRLEAAKKKLAPPPKKNVQAKKTKPK